MMRVVVQLEKTDEVQASVTITGTLSELRELMKQLSEKWPSNRVSIALSRAIQKAETTFHEPVEDR